MHKIGFDDNLGLPSNFAKTVGCQIISYHDLSELIADFISDKLNAIFVPAGTLLFINKPYQVLAQATLGVERKTKLCTSLVSLNMKTLELTDKVLGRVNPYCTTSFWAPCIYALKHLPQDISLKFKDTGSFEKMLEQTVTGQVDYAMIWDEIFKKYPDQAKKLRTLCQYDDLPTPVIIGENNLPQTLIKKLQHFYQPETCSFFNGFIRPNKSHIDQFIVDMRTAQKAMDT